ncbi:MAG TPA: hypothetical protein VFX76_13100, partial [Roseiflexaceae bacterium]|nr:hypothetical protein [Roseiflexaceae bacterium]
VAVAQAFGGHATAFEDLSPVRVFADALHVLAASLWSGGVLALAVVVVPLFRHGADEARFAWAILRSFGALAAAALATLSATGARAGDWQFLVTVKRLGLPDTVVALPWEVAMPAPPPHPVWISNRPLAPFMTFAALLLALLLTGIAVAVQLRSRTPPMAWGLLARLAHRSRGIAPRERSMPAEERVSQ